MAEQCESRSQAPSLAADFYTDSEYYQGIQSGSTAVTSTGTRDVFVGMPDDDETNPTEPAATGATDEQEPNWVTTFPEPIEIDQEFLMRGKAKFDIYCSVCHGYAGNGDGLVNQRAMALNSTGQAAWTTAKSLHDPEVKQNPVGRIFDTISNGRSSMGPYKDQISVEDRWAIVAYVKALQATGIEPEGAIAANTEPANEESSRP